MSFRDFEDAMRVAFSKKRILGATVAMTAEDREELQYIRAFGQVSVDEGQGPMLPDSMMWIASCTKLMTAVAVMQCVERGLLDLDGDICNILPEWKSARIILGFDERTGEPLTKPLSTPITLRQLLTHSSGMGYDGLNLTLRRYRKVHRGREPSLEINSIADDHTVVLTFEPGQGWDYGSGIDWAGQMVERVNGGQRLGSYMSQHIWKPLGMESTTFELPQHPDLLKRLCAFPARLPSGQLAPDTSGIFPVINPKDDSGGSGAYSCATDYIKLLDSLLHDDGRLLKPETVAELFRPQLHDTTHLEHALAGPLAQYLIPGMPPGTKWNHALGGIVAVDGIEGRAGKGTMMWWGLPNSYWFIDKERGVCGVYASQLLPPGDEESAALNALFQRCAYGTMA